MTIGYIESFDRKGIDARALYRRSVEYNPTIVKYYNSSDEVVRVEETWRGKTIAQTISGSTTSGTEQWPSYSYYVTTSAWEDVTTVSSGATSSGVNHVFIAYPY